MIEEPELLATCWTSAGDAAPMRADERSPVPIGERIDEVAAAGWQGIGLLHADLAATRQELGWSRLATMIQDAGLRHIEIELLDNWWTEGDQRERSDRIRDDLLAAAETLRPRHIKAAAGFADRQVDRGHLCLEFDRLCSQAAEVGTRIALEPMPWSHVPAIEDGADVVLEVGNVSGGLCVDVWHVVRGGTPFSDLRAILSNVPVFAVELNDGDRDPVRADPFEETINDRRLCGDGAWDIPAFIRVMRESGFDGPWGVEIISEQHRRRPVREAVEAARQTTLACFAQA